MFKKFFSELSLKKSIKRRELFLSSSNSSSGTHGISYVTIASTGNDTEFGEQAPVRRNPSGGYGGLSGSHGGIG